MPPPTLRIARPATNLTALTAFYTTGLGLQVISSFTNHSGFDGVMLGHPDCSAWHLEFTYQHSKSGTEHSSSEAVSQQPQELEGLLEPLPQPSRENLLVFYVPDRAEWEAAVERVERAGGKRVKSGNPYWDVCGATFEDPDGWRVVLQNAGWP